MGRPKRLYPLGKYRIRIRNGADKEKTYPIELEYTWGLDTVRRTTNIHVKASDWNPKGNQGRGEIRASYGNEYKRLNQVLINRVDRIDPQLAEYYEKHPNQITTEVIRGFVFDKPLNRKDQGKDFAEFVFERLESDYSRHKIGRSRYKNGICCMNVFATFLRSTNQGTYDRDKIYVGDISPELIDGYITWRRDIRQNGDETINHSLTPILKACSYAADMGMIEPAINARIQDIQCTLRDIRLP